MFVERFNIKVSDTNQEEIKKIVNVYKYQDKDIEKIGGKIEIINNDEKYGLKVYISKNEMVDKTTPHYIGQEENINNQYVHIGYLDKETYNKILSLYNNMDIEKYYMNLSIVENDNEYEVYCEIAFHNGIVNNKRTSQPVRKKSSKKPLIIILIVIVAILLIIGGFFVLKHFNIIGDAVTNPVSSVIAKVTIKDKVVTAENYEELSTQLVDELGDSDEVYYYSYACMYYIFKDGFSEEYLKTQDESLMYKNIYNKTVQTLIDEGKELMEKNNISVDDFKQSLQSGTSNIIE